MKWFKHFTDNHRGRSIQRLMDEMGHAGLAYYILMEMCAEKLERHSDNQLADSDCIFSFHRAVIQNGLRMKWKSARRVLGISQECNLLKFSESENEVRIEMPILLDLLDYDSKKSRQRRAQVTPESRLEKNRIETEKIRTEQDSSSTVAVETALVAAEPRGLVVFKNEVALISAVPRKTLERWGQLYPDEAFLNRELLKAFNYYENNSIKRPKTMRGWCQALSSWFERGWVKHVVTIKGQPGSNIDWDKVFGKSGS